MFHLYFSTFRYNQEASVVKRLSSVDMDSANQVRILDNFFFFSVSLRTFGENMNLFNPIYSKE